MHPPTPEQFERLGQQIAPMLAKLLRLRQRLIARGYVPGEPFYDSVDKTIDAMHELNVRTHYKSVSRGVG